MEGAHSQQRLLEAFLTCVANDIVPLTAQRIGRGKGRMFGAAILRKRDLSLVIAECNVDNECPVSGAHISRGSLARATAARF